MRADTPMVNIRILAAVLAAATISLLPAIKAAAVPAAPSFGPIVDPYSPYEGQSRCDPRPKRGLKSFQALVLAAYPGTGAGSISRPCSVGGRSEHKEGRAWDWGVRASVASERASAEEMIDWLLARDDFGTGTRWRGDWGSCT